MSVRRRAALLACAILGTLAVVAPAQAGPKRPPGKPSLVGTYQRMNKDIVQPDGTLRDVYRDLLVTPDRVWTLRLPKGAHVHGGSTVRVTGLARGADFEAQEVEELAVATPPPATGTTSTLVMLAYWTSPDSVTTAQAKAQFFTDDHGWFQEASYKQLGLSGTATGWLKIAGPSGGHCYTNHDQIMDQARAAASGAGFTVANYSRHVVYFPRCSGSDSAGAAGWAYQPGTEVWLNGYMDRRVSVHEMGHNYGLEHAHAYHCTQGSTRVSLGGTCSHDEYGDEYDAMGGGEYAGHFSATMKNQLGWLVNGRKKTLTSAETTFTLAPFESMSTTPPVAAVATSPAASTRTYWMEYRQPTGYDATLPLGATGGVLVHMRDTAVVPGPYLLDTSPLDPYENAVIPPGGAWTSPDGVRISVGSATASGVSVTVKGGVAPPVAPSAPQALTATAGDGSVKLSWSPPASNGGSTVAGYTVSMGGVVQESLVPGTSYEVDGLDNGTAYAFSVAARNAVGTGPAATAGATPTAQLPSVVLTSPSDGATLSGVVSLAATALPHPVSQTPIEYVDYAVDGQSVASSDTAPFSATWDTSWLDDGTYTLTATAYDSTYRYATSAPVQVTVKSPRPAVTLTAPAGGATITGDSVELSASVTPAPGTTINEVAFSIGDDQTVGWDWDAPYSATWDTSQLPNGPVTVTAVAIDSNGRMGRSEPVTVTIDHPLPTVALTAPAAGAEVIGNAVAVSADASPNATTGAAISYVQFIADGTTEIGFDYEAPYETTWDTTGLAGPHVVTARAVDADGRAAVSAPRAVTVANPVPSVAVTSPVPYSTVSGAVPLAASATPSPVSNAAIESVSFEVDGEPAGTDTQAPYTATWNGIWPGQHSVVAIATDAGGQTARSAPVQFTVPQPAPTVAISSPLDGAFVRSGMRTVTAAVAPDATTGSAVESGDLYVDGVLVASDFDASDGLSFQWEATRGAHVLTAYAYDGNFDTGTSLPVQVTVADAPGVPTGVTAQPGLNGTATVSWTPPADDGGSPVTGYVVKTGAATYTATQSPFTVTGLANGTAYAFTVASRNAAGDSVPSGATPAVTPGTRTQLSIGMSPTLVNAGGYVTVKGTLRRNDTGGVFPGRTIQLLACAKGTLRCGVVKTATTDVNGAVSMTYAPPQHKDMRLRFNQWGQFLPYTTTPRLVQVRVVVTSAMNKASMPLGATATLTGSVRPAHSGRYVYLQRYYNGAWRPAGQRAQSSTGAVSLAIRPTARGTYTYRWYFPSDADHLGSYSPQRTVKVT